MLALVLGVVVLSVVPLGFAPQAVAQAAPIAQAPPQAQPTQSEVENTTQPPGMNVQHPGRTAGERPVPGTAGENPLNTPSAPAPPDTSSQASPLGRAARTSSGSPGLQGVLKIGTGIPMRLSAGLSSGTQRNGDLVEGTLAEPVRLSSGTVLPQGTPVTATIVSSARAGVIQSGGVLSLELVRIAGVPITTDIRAFDGREGHKDVADSAPDKGEEAVVKAGTVLEFHVTT